MNFSPLVLTKLTRKGIFLAVSTIFFCSLFVLQSHAQTTFTVNQVDDTGAGSLRQAILDANANPGQDIIEFNIPGTGPFTIRPTVVNPLPTITDPLIIDGYTQPGASENTNPLGLGSNAVLKIEIDGSLAGVSVNGLRITAGNSTVRGLVINRFTDVGIQLETNGGNIIEGNYIGIDVGGTSDRGNADDGVRIFSPNNKVGGTTAGARNVISGNDDVGVEINGSGATGNLVQGNYIGIKANGIEALGNSNEGVLIANAANDTIGGTTTGAGNVISGNGADGVGITGTLSTGNTVSGNLIGTDASGLVPLGNGIHGVAIVNGPDVNVIGGTISGAGNVIAGNTQHGIQIIGEGTDANLVRGNLIGTDATGLSSLANGGVGVQIFIATNNTIGGTTTGARNVISGNGADGVRIASGGLPGGGAGNLVQGNFIGTDANSTVALGNTSHGVFITGASGNTIGGATLGAGNVISGNLQEGIRIQGSGATGNQVMGNLIGTDNSGTLKVRNGTAGVAITTSASNNTIGGLTTAERNIISGNDNGAGISINPGCNGNNVLGNYIGTNFDGTAALENSIGVVIGSASNNTIGPGNVISGNTTNGIHITGQLANNNNILGNFIGVKASGTDALGNGNTGVVLNSPNNFVGGPAVADRNIISGNVFGVVVQGADANNNQIVGNYIGTNVSGTIAIGNTNHGIFVGDGTNNTIGPDNVISGNVLHGILLIDNTQSNQIVGNFIGTNADGTNALPNPVGIKILGASNNTIGGTSSENRNVISGNSEGILIVSSSSTGNKVQGNYIGTDVNGTSPVGNTGNGVRFGLQNGASSGNLIGGTLPGADNLIAYNSGQGVALAGGINNGILSNSIHSNGGLGIDLNHSFDIDPNGITYNDLGDGDTGSNNLQNFPVIMNVVANSGVTIQGRFNSVAGDDYRLEFFASSAADPSGYGEGERFLGAINITNHVGGDEPFTAVLSVPVASGEFITATATNLNTGDTSEFSAAMEVTENNSALLDGGGSRIRITDGNPANPSANPGAYQITGSAITVEAWVYPLGFPNTLKTPIVQRPISAPNVDPFETYSLYLRNGKPHFAISTGDPGSGVVINAGSALPTFQWTHLAGTYDGNDLRLYVNGTEVVPSVSTNISIGDAGIGFYIGRFVTGAFSGLIDDVRLWNATRSGSDITTNMNAVLTGSESGLAGYWRLDATTTIDGKVVTVDKTGSHNDLIVKGAKTEFVYYNPLESFDPPDISVSTTAIDFGIIEQASEHATRNLEIENQGNGPLIGALFVNGGDIEGGGVFFVPANSTESEEVTVRALVTGPLTSSLDVHSNDPPIVSIPISLTSIPVHRFDANNIGMWVRRNGHLARDPFSGNAGFEWPKGSDITAIFSAGIWLGAQVGGEVRVAAEEYNSEFSPGPIVNEMAADPNDTKYRVYKIQTGDNVNNPDYAEWPVNLGAPVMADGITPMILGDQTLFTVYNDLDPDRHSVFGTSPLAAEVQQTIFGYNQSGALGDAVFIRYKVINRGNATWENTYLALWNDPDLGDHRDDLVGIDLSRNLGYVYNGDNDDEANFYNPGYGSTPPAVGFDILKGAFFTNSIQAFSYFYSGATFPLSDPQDGNQAYNFMQGLLADGSPFIDPTTSMATPFPLNGDPVPPSSGWVDSDPSDRRFLLSTGPFNLAPGQSKELIAAIIVGQGTDNLNSITELRSASDEIQALFQDGGVDVAAQPAISAGHVSEAFVVGLNEPQGLAFDQAGNLIVAATGSGELVRFDNDGNSELLAFNFSRPIDVAVDGNNTLYVTDLDFNGVFTINLNAVSLPVSASAFTTLVSGLDGPTHLEFGPSGDLFVSVVRGISNDRVMKVNVTTADTIKYVGFPTDVNHNPQGLAFDTNGNMFLAIQFLGEVRKVSSLETPPIDGGAMPVVLQGLDSPGGIDFGSDDRLFVATRNAVMVSRRNTQSWSTFVSGLSGDSFNNLLFSDDGQLFVADKAGGRILRIAVPKQQVLAQGNFPLHFKINENGDPAITDNSDLIAIRNAFQNWQDVSTSTVAFADDGLTPLTNASATDGVNLVTFSDEEFLFPPLVLAVAAKTIQFSNTAGTAEIVDADIVFNPNFTNNPNFKFGTDSSPGQFDIESIATHEAGHVIGLVHSGVLDATMFFVLQPGTEARSLVLDDQAWASHLYPETNFLSSFGSISGNIEDGENPGSSVAGALVLASNMANGDSVHAYSDENGDYLIPGLPPGTYKVFIQSLDGNVGGFPMTPAHVSAYLQTITSITDFPQEFFNGSDESSNPFTDDPKDSTLVTVIAEQETPDINLITNRDLTPPEIKAVFPANLATGVLVSSEILVTFSEPIDKNSFVQSFALDTLNSGGSAVEGSFLFLNRDSVAVFTPQTALAFNTTYSIDISTGVTDKRGNALTAGFSGSFTTELPDTDAPTVAQIIPVNGSMNVFITSDVTVIFSEPMDPQSLTVSTSSSPNSGSFTLSSSAGEVLGSLTLDQGNTVAVFNPEASLAENTTYTVTLADTIKDASGNPLASVFTSTFKTVPQADPTIVDFGPADGATGITVKTTVFVDFSEPMDTGSIRNAFTLSSGGAAVQGNFELLNQDSRVVFRPSTDLNFNTTYMVTITTNAQDVSQPPRTLIQTFTKSFTTTTQVVVPVITSVSPPSAYVESVVVINGAGFDAKPANNAVSFNGTAAVVTAATLNSLTTRVPQGATSGPLTVTVNGEVSNAFQFGVLTSVESANNVVATVNAETGPRDADVNPEGTLAYVTNSGTNSVTVIDLVNTSVLTNIPVGNTPVKIAINPQGNLAYVTNFVSNTVSVIDINTNQVIATIPVGINPIGVAVTPDGQRVYVAEFTSKGLSIIDAEPTSGAFNQVVARVNTETGNRDVEVNPDGTLAFVTGTAGLTILSIDPVASNFNSVVARVNTETGTRDVDVAPNGGLAVVTTIDGNILIIDVYPNSPGFANVVAKVNTETGSREVEISPDGTLVYATNFETNTVSVYEFVYTPGGIIATGVGAVTSTDETPITTSTVDLKLVDVIPVGDNPEAIVINPKTLVVVVVNSGSNNVSVINIAGFSTPDEGIQFNIGDVQNLLDGQGTPRKARKHLELANKSLEKALDRLDEGKVTQVFDEIKTAVHELEKAEKYGVNVSQIVNSLVGIARRLARDAFQDAQPFAGDKKVDKELETAEQELQKGDLEQTNGNSGKAIDHYKKAWEHAQKAIDKYDNADDGLEKATGSSTSESGLPKEFSLSQNFPNPFNPSTTIQFGIPASAESGVRVELKIYNILGQLVTTLVDEMKLPGRYTVTWNGRHDNGMPAASGLYLFKIKAGEFQKVMKMVLLQ